MKYILICVLLCLYGSMFVGCNKSANEEPAEPVLEDKIEVPEDLRITKDGVSIGGSDSDSE